MMKPLKLLDVCSITKPAYPYSNRCARVFWIDLNLGDGLNVVAFVGRQSGHREKFNVIKGV